MVNKFFLKLSEKMQRNISSRLLKKLRSFASYQTVVAFGLEKVNYNFTIINAYTQYGYDPATKPVDYEAIYNAFKQIKMLYDMNPMATMRIGIPKIGAGLAGGDWNRIEQIIDSIGFSDLTCVVFDG